MVYLKKYINRLFGGVIHGISYGRKLVHDRTSERHLVKEIQNRR